MTALHDTVETDMLGAVGRLAALLDSVQLPPLERLRLTKELASIRVDLASNPPVMQRLTLAKRLSELRRKLMGDPVAAEKKPEPVPERPDAPQFGLTVSGIKTREKINAQVRGIVARVKDQGLTLAQLSEDERAALAQYSGRGGLTDNSQSEYYTPTPVAEGVWELMAENGGGSGNMLEPSTGAGVFSATKPKGIVISGAEIDETSSAVAQLLHPEDRITNTSFERYAMSVPDGSFDGCAGNVPFGVRGREAHHDPAHRSEKRMERYFVRRVIDKVRPGGLIVLIVPVSVIGNKQKGWATWRAELSLHAEFLGGHKLPSKTFGKQGTDVVTDIIVLRKHPAELAEKIQALPVDTLRTAGVLWQEWIDGRYFEGEGRQFIHGTFVPRDPTAVRSEDKVVAPPDLTDEALKRKIAARFDSRIDWDALEVAEPRPQVYAEGDRKVINGQPMEFRAGQWVQFTPNAPEDVVLDKAKFGVSSLQELESLLTTPDGMLSLTSAQAYACWRKYPHLFSGIQQQAVEFAMGQPQDKFREVAYRGSLLGAMANKFAVGQDATDRPRVIELLKAEFAKYGHPTKISGMVLSGERARDFGAYLAAIDSTGRVADTVSGEVTEVRGFDPENVLSIVAHLIKTGAEPIEVGDVAKLYGGPRKLAALGDVADISGVVITPDGFLSTVGEWCNGDVYDKVGAIQAAMSTESDARVKAHWQALIDRLMGSVRHTDITAIGFGLRDNWIPARYKLEFLGQQGLQLTFRELITEEAQDGEDGASAAAPTGGVWSYAGKHEFSRQLVHYMTGRSIGHNLKDRADSDASERKAEYQEKVNGMEEQFRFFMQAHRDGVELAATYDMTFNRNVVKDYDTSDLGLKGVSAGVKMHPYQNSGVRRLSDEGNGILGFDVGLGKAQPLDEPVLTPDGWKPMGNIKIGDFVISADGSPTEVVGVFPQGVKPSYRVTFNDGSSTRCCDEHLWFTKTALDRNNERRAVGSRGGVKTLREIMCSLTYSNVKNHSIPMVDPVEMPERDLPIHPYLLGAVIGDGCLTGYSPTVTKPDRWMLDRICSLTSECMPDVKATIRGHDGRCPAVHMSAAANRRFDDLGLLGKKSEHKFIPDAYMVSSINQRLDLLRGLMDTDGWVSKDGTIVQFTSTSRLLADQVRELAMSLGANAWITTKIPKFTYKGEKKDGREAFTVGLRMPPTINPFALPRKADLWRPNTKYLPTRLIESVEYVGDVPQQCIAVAHESHLYVTRDFIVTHNTFTSLAFSAYDRQMGRSKKHCIVVPKSVLANWYMESKKFLGNHDGVLFVGFEPKRDKAGAIVTEAVLDENSRPKRNEHTGQIEYQDVLVEDSPAEAFAKMHSIPAKDGGLVVMTYEKFKVIPVKPETVEAHGEKWVERSMASKAALAKLTEGKAAKAGSYAEKQQIANLEFGAFGEGTKKKGELPYFEDMGFDRVIVDEAHNFRASFQVKEGLDKLAYLPNPAESQRAQDMAIKLAYLRDANGGKGSILLTATPVANSPIEIYNMLMHVCPPEELDKLGIYTPADFVRFFGKIETVQKLLVTGEIGDRDGLKGFRNLGILRGLFHRYANMLGPKDVDPEGNVLKLPEAQEVKSQAHMTSEQSDAYIELREEAKKAGNPKNIKSGEARPMFAVLRDMDRVTTDIDLYRGTMTFLFRADQADKVRAMIDALPATIAKEVVDEDTDEKVKIDVPKESGFRTDGETIVYVAPDIFEYAVVSRLKKFGITYTSHPIQPKYAELIKNLKAEMAANGKQIVFTEEKSQHGKLERLLIENLPEADERIGIINADTAGGEKLQAIADAFTRGDYRIIIANKKAEVGVNLQRGTTAVHHMTLPWTPASIQQRNGRAVRQGNKAASVRVYYYQAAGSFDEYRLDLLKKKGNWINALLSKDNGEDEHDNENAGSEAEYGALLSDNREEFLAKLADQQAKREAAAKERRDQAAKVGLMQLTQAREFLRTFDQRKAMELARVADEVEKARKSLATAQSAADTPDKAALVARRAANVKRAEEKLAKAGPDMDKRRADADSRVRQISASLKSQASRGELPFSATIVESPEDAVVTLSKVVVSKGAMFEVGKDVFRILDVNAAERTVSVEVVLSEKQGYGAPRSGTYDADKLIGPHGVEVHLSADEITLRKVLSTPQKYAEIANLLSKDAFLERRGSIGFSGYILVELSDGSIKTAFGRPDQREGQTVYPDKSDRVLRSKVAALYADELSKGRGNFSSYEQNEIMPALFGSDWRNAVAEFVKTAKREDVTAKASELLARVVPAVISTEAQATEVLAELANIYRAFGGGLGTKTAFEVGFTEWLDAGGYANRREAISWAKGVAAVKVPDVTREAQKIRAEAAAAAERNRLDAMRSDPRFRALNEGQELRFSTLGIVTKYNNGERAGKWPEFSVLTLKDRMGKAGVLYPVKEILKPRFGAQFISQSSAGYNSPYAETWAVPSRTDVDALLDFLES